jgi:hypothetical protein
VTSHAGVWRATASEQTGGEPGNRYAPSGRRLPEAFRSGSDQAPAGGVGLGPTRVA